MRVFALVLLVLGMYAQYGYLLAPPDIDVQGQVWNISQTGVQLLLLGAVAVLSRSFSVQCVCMLLAAYGCLVIGCSALWLWEPWPQIAGQPQCSTRFHIPLGVLGMVAGLLLVCVLAKRWSDG